MDSVNFDRGGTLPKRIQKKTQENDFGAQSVENEKSKQKKTHKRDRIKKIKEANAEGQAKDTNVASLLNLTSLSNDMIVMGIVKAAYQTHLFVSLPGRLVGKVPISNISKSYTGFVQKIIESQDLTVKPKSLPELFTQGQVVYVKVVDKSHGEKQEILLSLVPEDINSEVSVANLAEGNVIMCAVEEEEDHGYLMECGLKNIRAFLPKKNIKTNLSIGEHSYCKILQISSTTLTLSMFKKNELVKIDTIDVPNLKTLMPGSVVDFNIARILKNGVEGLLFDGSVSAYANELNLPSKFALTDIDIIGKEVKARILYTMPFSNQIFVTLITDDVKGKTEFKFGTLIPNAKVIKQTSNGVLFRLSAKSRGFIPKRAIIKNLKINFDLESALMKFSPNSAHEVRVMEYNAFEDCYLCTNDKKMLHEKYFGTFDLQFGSIALAKVQEKTSNGYRVSVGNVRGFLRGAFLNPTSKLNLGDVIKVRVAEIDHEAKFVQVTNLSGFLRENANILSHKNQVKFQEVYTGVVMSETETYYLILFFNHIKATLMKNPESEAEILSVGGLKVGSVSNFEVKSVKGDRITVGIPKVIDTTNLGKIFEATVKAILPSGLQIYVNELKCHGKIPISFLSEFSQLSNLIHANIKENEKIDVVSLGSNLFSRRDVEYFKSGVIDDFKDLVPGDVVRCHVKSTDEDNIELQCPLKNFNQTITLNRNAFDNPENVKLNSGDVLYVKVIGKNESHKNSLYVTPSLHKVWKDEMELPLNMLKSYLNDVDYLLDKQNKAGKALAKFSIGQRVSGVIKQNIGKNLLIEIKDGVFAQGLVENAQAYKLNGNVKDAVIVFIDPVTNMIHVTLIDKCKDEISIDQKIDSKLVNEKRHKAVVVYFNDFVTVSSIRKSGQPLIYSPSKFHYNDFSSTTNRTLGIATSKLVIKRAVGNRLFGIFVQDYKIFMRMEKFINKLGKRKAENLTLDSSKLPKVVLDSDNEDENVMEDDEEQRKTETEDEIEEESPKKPTKAPKMKEKSFAKSLKGTMKKTKNLRVPLKKKILAHKDSLLDDNVVNLVSFKKLKEGQQQQISPKKSAFGKKKNNKKKNKKFVK